MSAHNIHFRGSDTFSSSSVMISNDSFTSGTIPSKNDYTPEDGATYDDTSMAGQRFFIVQEIEVFAVK